MKFEFTIKTKLWIYKGEAGWQFVTINKRLSARIKAVVKDYSRGFGSVKVKASIGDTEWTTSIFPTKEKEYLLPIKAAIRKSNNLTPGDLVTVHFYLVGY